MPKYAADILGWGLLQAGEIDKSVRDAGPRKSAQGSLDCDQQAAENCLVQQLSSSTLLTELKRRADGAGMTEWKLTLTSSTVRAVPMGMLMHLMKGSNSLMAGATPATSAGEKEETNAEEQSSGSVPLGTLT